MKLNKKGFISISVVYSFFLIFLFLLLFIINGYTNNRILLRNIKNEIKNDISDTNFARFLINHSEDLGLENHNDDISDGAIDNSYRYAGLDVNNYVCFGTDATTCPTDNLYRIIGVINGKVKLIKNTSIGEYNFDNTDTSTYVNTWIYKYLNNEFLESLGEYQEKIELTTWYVGGIDITNTEKAIYEIYNYELGLNKNNGVTVNAYIGLPYISDYGYASDLSSYSSPIKESNNWMFPSANMWFITRTNIYTNQAFYLTQTGTLSYTTVNNTYQIRPTFFLNGSTKKVSGTGTITDPYKVG